MFGSWFGELYEDNSKALFEYVNKKDKKIKPIWISKNKRIIEYLRKKIIKRFII